MYLQVVHSVAKVVQAVLQTMQIFIAPYTVQQLKILNDNILV